MKAVGVTDYTNQTPSKHFEQNMSSVQVPEKQKKISVKCPQNRCTSRCVNNHYAKLTIKE